MLLFTLFSAYFFYRKSCTDIWSEAKGPKSYATTVATRKKKQALLLNLLSLPEFFSHFFLTRPSFPVFEPWLINQAAAAAAYSRRSASNYLQQPFAFHLSFLFAEELFWLKIRKDSRYIEMTPRSILILVLSVLPAKLSSRKLFLNAFCICQRLAASGFFCLFHLHLMMCLCLHELSLE